MFSRGLLRTVGHRSNIGLTRTPLASFSSVEVPQYVMSIDQGTTSSRVLLINQDLQIVDSASREHD